jgi:serine/threonine-protein kinase RsbW
MTSTAGRELHLTIGSRFENIELVQAVVDDALREGGAAEDARHWIGLALREAVANAIKHGNRQDPDKQVEIQASFAPEEVEIRIDDEGAGFDPLGVVDPLAPENRFRASGRGIFYMRKFMDEVEFESGPSGGTRLRLRKRLTPAPDASNER